MLWTSGRSRRCLRDFHLQILDTEQIPDLAFDRAEQILSRSLPTSGCCICRCFFTRFRPDRSMMPFVSSPSTVRISRIAGT